MTTPQRPQQGDIRTAPAHGRVTVDQAAGQPYGASVPSIPQQWAPAGLAHQPTGWAPLPPAPRNGLGIAALCLGVVGLLFGIVPFTGFIAFALGAVGVILGVAGFALARRGTATNTVTAVSGTVVSAIAIALGVWGMVIVFTGLNRLAEDLESVPGPVAPVSAPVGAAGPQIGGPPAAATPAEVSADETSAHEAPMQDAPTYEAPSYGTPSYESPSYESPAYGASSLPAYETPAAAGPVSYRLEVTGTATRMMLSYGTSNAMSSSSDYRSLPWSTTVETSGDRPYASISAISSGPGSITCTITDTATGEVVSTQASQSLDDSEYSSASVSCTAP